MNTLRRITQWISKHRIISITSVVLLISILFAVKEISNRSQGTLTDPIKKGQIVDAVYGIGTVTATRSYSVKPGIIATIGNLYVKEGDFVHQGDKLVRIESVEYRAPFAGVVNYLPFKVGENIFTQFPALVLTDLANRYLVVTLEQQGALRVRAGQKAKLSFDSIRGQSFEGEVKSVYSYNGNFLARIEVPALPPEILPDMTADIAIIVKTIEDALLLPVSAFENGFVWVKRGHSIPSKTPVRLGVVDGTSAQSISGDLHEGDTLMVRKKVAQ